MVINLTTFTINPDGTICTRNFLNFDNICHSSVVGDELMMTNKAKGYFITVISYDPDTNSDIIDVVYQHGTEGYTLDMTQPWLSVSKCNESLALAQ